MKAEITTAKSAGFCFGVDRAVKLVYQALREGKRVATLGPIVHNDAVVSDLAAKGAGIIHDPAELEPGETLIIRAHGVPKAVYAQAEATGNPVIDATCPFVARIHKIAAEQSAQGVHVWIAGDPQHPEVQGIVGHCDENCTVFRDEKELRCLIDRSLPKRVAIVAQTTYNKLLWGECIGLLPAGHPDLQVYDTICNATAARQSDADQLSHDSDLMIVAGGRHSSNTVKLYDVCSRNCPAWLIENAQELAECAGEIRAAAEAVIAEKGPDHVLKIGITAGASTPSHIIKEVQTNMSGIFDTDTITPESEEFAAAFEEELDKTFTKKIRKGDRVTGIVASISGNNEVMVDVGAKQTGYITLSELTSDTSKKPSDLVKVGDELELVVIQVNDAEGTVQLSKRRVDEMVGFENILKAREANEVLEGTVISVVKGGLVADCNGVHVFIPASQSGLGRGADLNVLLKTPVRFVIIDVNEQRRRAVGSIRQVQKTERDAAKAKFWENAKVGDVYTGEVKSLTSYGAFVDLGGIDGMVHVSELSWSRIHQPSDVVAVGDTLEVYIKALDPETGRISLGHRRPEDNPWTKFTSQYSVGDIVEASIASVTAFGAFARIADGIDGLIHISQLSNERVTNVKDVVNVGDTVTVKITAIDSEKQRISLSMRAVSDDAAAEEAQEADEVVYSDDAPAAEAPAEDAAE
ncbi:MAG: bifunctional 4-hydroxy-3-methylbut-2-enyl diphosphate reductase/30S ribosomal protein S1 [Oscillospiraceae bacterium]|nr:bifunctional 4-hydroxy-3-methylbut-2-enyl diphosphate reductase/30S ribosomal protein S1 [Oscillospiraceae bacterium]